MLSREDILRMAREADIIDFRDDDSDPHVKQMIDFFEVVIERAVAAEREACAVICEQQAERSDAAMLKAKRVKDRDIYSAAGQTAHWNAADIRARKPCLNGEPLANQRKTSGSLIKEKDS